MTPKQCSQAAIAELDALSGYPTVVQTDQSLTVLATVRHAGPHTPGNIIRLNPKAGAIADYLICHQCGFAGRYFATPEKERWEIGPALKGRRDVDRLTEEQFSRQGIRLPPEARSKFSSQLLSGLLVQLRSMPIGIRIDSEIAKRYPAVFEQQREAAEKQLADNRAVLAPEIKKISPGQIHSASCSMNAAFASYWATVWQEATIITPYKTAGFLQQGQELLAVLSSESEEPAADVGIVKKWATVLGIADWFKIETRTEV